ncbi:RNA polymerase sigma factor [Acidovorax sp. FG27]|uniref:RNA polymerase sigma factor n=1 Tax=Acidovorax sp. FG27 TaxID=3133652 RepID=UPI0030E80B63
MNRAQVQDHLPGLRRYARMLTGDRWAADDLVQDTLERACRKWLLWRAGTDLRAWLFTLMHNLYLNQRRGAPPLHLLDGQDAAAELPAATGLSHDTALDLERCLQRLPPDQRAVLLLVTLEDLPYTEVARVLGVPVGTVMSRLSRARSRMREWMESADQRPGGVAPVPADAARTPADAPPALRRLK